MTENINKDKVSGVSPKSNPTRLSFSQMQVRAALEAGRVQEISQKYIDALNEKILDLTNKSVALRKDAARIDAEIKKIKEEADDTEKTAQKSYSETLNLIIGELDPPEPPWEAHIVVDNGVPIGVDLIKKDS